MLDNNDGARIKDSIGRVSKNLKDVSLYTDTDTVKAFGLVKDYLKSYGDTIKVNNHKVKYIEYHIEREIEGELFGFEDELVYVGDKYITMTYTEGEKKGITEEVHAGETYIGMHERDMSIKQMKSFLKGIDRELLDEIIITGLANKALRDYNTHKNS